MKIIPYAYELSDWLNKDGYSLPKHPRQNGAELTNSDIDLSYLTTIVSDIYRQPMIPHLNASSWRTQEPTVGALNLHQDYEALTKICDPYKVDACTVWIPLISIDNFTPTLEVSPMSHSALQHKRDELGYAVIKDPYFYTPLISITELPATYGVLLDPWEVHRSCVQPWHTKTRQSLDIRFAAAA